MLHDPCLEEVRGSVLREALRVINVDREDQYGRPEDNFECIADLWGAYRGDTYTKQDVAIMMALLKIGRLSTGTAKRDSYVDACGYLALAADMAEAEDEQQ